MYFTSKRDVIGMDSDSLFYLKVTYMYCIYVNHVWCICKPSEVLLVHTVVSRTRWLEQCRESRTILLTGPLIGRLSSHSSEDHGAGTASCPFVIQGSPGQRVILSVLYFPSEYVESSSAGVSLRDGRLSNGALVGGGVQGSRQPCSLLELITVTEKGIAKGLTVCDFQVNSYVNVT